MEEPATTFQTDYIDLASEIVSAYVSNNSLPVAELPALLGNVHAALSGLASAATGTAGTEAPKATGAQVRKSITHDALISFEDGKPYKTLRRHLTIRNLTPEAYRAKWGLPVDYPMVAAAYSEQRSSLAKSLGLGQQRRKPAAKDAGADAAAETVQAPEAPEAEAVGAAPKAASRSATRSAPKAASAKSGASKRAPKAAAKAPAAGKPAKAPRRAKTAETAAGTAAETSADATAEAAPKARGKRKVAA
ncbi:MucR family transcriptional regulator [Methylobacterium planeticum]|uniref:MucR family transcriptional regulator n=1 Tax=Methylobacterium planeticum TaxID=2615211 RepID=A0A6N6MUN5_9HYPH|nr:MucR family transcriptional regulator [Methylobacterium planeticum]